MKHALLTTVMLIPFLFACNKSENPQPVVGPTSHTSSLSAAQAKESTGPKINSSVHKSGWCDGWPLDCVYLGGVDVKPTVRTLIDGVSGLAPTLVAQVFLLPDLTDVNAYLGSDITYGLQTGQLYIVKFGETETTTAYLIGSKLPLTVDNKLVALQLNK